MMIMLLPIVVTLVGIVTDVRDVHELKPPSLIVVTVVGIVILVIGQEAYCK